MPKVLILTDSNGNPRSFPPLEMFPLEETYPYIIRSKFKDSDFWQLSYGNITTEELISQPTAYLTHWKPEIVIVQSGIADCRPEAFTEFQKTIIMNVTWKLFAKLKKVVYHPSLIRKRQKSRVSIRKFKKTLKKFKLNFRQSKIFWLEIVAGHEYENTRPGVFRRMEEYNGLIKEIYKEDFVPIQDKLLEINGFNATDFVHCNGRAHKHIADVLIERIQNFLDKSTAT